MTLQMICHRKQIYPCMLMTQKYGVELRLRMTIGCSSGIITVFKIGHVLIRWCFTPQKVTFFSITRAYSMNLSVNFVYSMPMNETAIEYTDIENDFVLHINSKLDWSHHCDTIYSKASQRLGLLKRTCYFSKNTPFSNLGGETWIDTKKRSQVDPLWYLLEPQGQKRYFLACKELNILPLLSLVRIYYFFIISFM